MQTSFPLTLLLCTWSTHPLKSLPTTTLTRMCPKNGPKLTRRETTDDKKSVVMTITGTVTAQPHQNRSHSSWELPIYACWVNKPMIGCSWVVLIKMLLFLPEPVRRFFKPRFCSASQCVMYKPGMYKVQFLMSPPSNSRDLESLRVTFQNPFWLLAPCSLRGTNQDLQLSPWGRGALVILFQKHSPHQSLAW